MTDRRNKVPTTLEAIERAAARVLRKVSDEIADAPERARRGQEEVERYIDERERSIRSGARRAGKRFRL